MSDNTINSTTQEYLDVYDIANDMVILKDGVVSIIMQIGTMNFSLLAEQEQDAIMYTYGALLNSLNFPVQINIQSNIKDASRYLRLLDNQIKQSKSRAKSQLIAEYRDFVANLIRERNVLEKKFFVTIPTNAAEMGLYSAESVLPGKTKFDINTFEKTILIEKATTILDPRRDHLIAQFNRLGLFARQLDTQEIIQNFYINYNPESNEGQEVTNSESYTTPIVRASLANEPNANELQDFRQTITSSLGQATEQLVAEKNSLETEPSTELPHTSPTENQAPIERASTSEPLIDQSPTSYPTVDQTPINRSATIQEAIDQSPPTVPSFTEEIASFQSNYTNPATSNNQTINEDQNLSVQENLHQDSQEIKKTSKPNIAEL